MYFCVKIIQMKPLITFFTLLLAFSSIAQAQPTITSFSPTSATPGMELTITGSGFTGASSVSIGDIPVSFNVISNTQIKLTLPVVATGSISVTAPGGQVSRAGFIYIPTSGIITDFGGFWNTTSALPNGVQPDDSHNLLAFTHNGITYSTGVNNSILTNNGINYIPASFKALPVASIAGLSAGGSTYIALASKVDGSRTSAYIAGVASYTIKEALIDGMNGLDLGTGVTNLPTSALMTFQIYNIDGAKANDAEPDIILTQIAQPSASNDEFTFLDEAGNPVGRSFVQDMTNLPRLGTYVLDLFSMAERISYNVARPYSVGASGTNTTRDIRVITLSLSDFGIDASNAASVKALRIKPSSNSDYAFIGYNSNSINLPPNVTQSPETSVSAVCAGGTASLAIEATAAMSGVLSFSWEESTDGGNSWHAVTDGGVYSGATTKRLNVANAIFGNKYRATVHETGNGNAGLSGEFTITSASTGTNPTSVTISGVSTVCTNISAQLVSTIVGGSNLLYQWQSDVSGGFQDIPGANSPNYVVETNKTGIVNYRLVVSIGGGCPGTTSASKSLEVFGIASASVTPFERCGPGIVELAATATAGRTVTWFDTESGGTELATTNTFNPTVTTTTTFYAAATGCAQRVPVIATISSPSTAGGIVEGDIVTPDGTITTLTISSQTGDVLKWQSSTDNFIADIQDIANTTSQLVIDNITKSTQYRAVVQSGSCETATTPVYMITLPIQNNIPQLKAQNGNVLVQWETYNQLGTEVFEIEKSLDGTNFVKAGSVNAHPAANYSWVDNNAPSGAVYYRIREVNIDGKYSYSEIAMIRLAGQAGDIYIYPNPVTGNLIQLYFNNMKAGKYTIQVFNTSGQIVHHGTIQHTTSVAQQSIRVSNGLTPGLHLVVITDAAGNKRNISVVAGK